MKHIQNTPTKTPTHHQQHQHQHLTVTKSNPPRQPSNIPSLIG